MILKKLTKLSAIKLFVKLVLSSYYLINEELAEGDAQAVRQNASFSLP